MAKANKEAKTDDPREKIIAYFKKRSGLLAKGSTTLQYLVREQCSAAGIGTSNEEMQAMAAGLASYRVKDYTLPPPKKDKG